MIKPFPEVNCDMIRGNRHNLEHIKIPSKIRKTFSIRRVVKHSVRLPRDFVDPPSSEFFKTCLWLRPDLIWTCCPQICLIFFEHAGTISTHFWSKRFQQFPKPACYWPLLVLRKFAKKQFCIQLIQYLHKFLKLNHTLTAFLSPVWKALSL